MRVAVSLRLPDDAENLAVADSRYQCPVSRCIRKCGDSYFDCSRDAFNLSVNLYLLRVAQRIEVASYVSRHAGKGEIDRAENLRGSRPSGCHKIIESRHVFLF